jgi:hypothetical protein
MSPRLRSALERFGRAVAAGALAASALAVPVFAADVIPVEYAAIAQPFLAGLLLALDKFRRYVAADEGAEA